MTYTMTYRMILIVAAVTIFAWGFSSLVERSGQTIRPENARVACQGLASDCTRPLTP